jgi:hypothetical protein
MIVWATEIKIRAERRTGELLRELAKSGQRRGRGQMSPGDDISKLKDFGISRDQSADWQHLAEIPL